MNFDPVTGQPINQNINNTLNSQINNVNVTPTTQMTQPIHTVQSEQTINNNTNIQQQMQNIPTVEQPKQEFINNTQASNAITGEQKKEGNNIVFIIILFVIIFAAIFFLFPYLLKVL